ncbi:S41 family peptidase [Aurantiacibacter sp. D1-12]|uniref:S41 family peptidase n=1 Tax=Aurantiacibacter sp. D1-12 TaxID=2993658 RepID=UPI00237C8D94|nr:S41 family peptidase [Aurantiacibacter sp. D1-12]MDE1468273.1 S41 family peptidase [Aurantiacibacter sp. D1-12]
MKRIATLAAALLATTASPAFAEEGFYQYPAAHGDTLVFASEGDLWRSARDGGSAIRLTNHEEEETNPAISPDGRWVAFNAAYDSSNDVYVMPVAGGAPRRLTFEGGGVRTVGWTPDGRVVFSSSAEGGGQAEVLYTVDPAGGGATPIPLWRAHDATYGSDGSLFFSRRGLRTRANDNAVQYRGGGMMQLWRWTGGNAEATQLLADFGAPIRNPMAHGGRIYFVSDRSGADAVWSVAEDGSGVTQHSEEFAFPVLQASMDGGDIVLQNGADLHVFSTASNTLSTLSLDIVSDREQTRPRTIDNPLTLTDAANIAPSGERVAVTARGRVALGAPGQARRVELTLPMDARAREAVESPDGEQVFLILDRGDARDLYSVPADGSGEPTAITRGYDAHIWSFDVAPDGESLIVRDKAARLQRVDVATGRVTLLRQNDSGSDNPFSGVSFSPDGDYVAYAEGGRENGGNTSDIYVQNVATGARVRGTSGKYNDYAPAFAHDGAWLYFISDRNFAPSPGSPWGDRNMGVGFPDRGGIYALQLDPESDFRFTEENELTRSSDEEEESEGASAEGEEGESSEEEEASANIVLSGLADRLYQVPADAGVGRMLLATENFLYTFRDDDAISIKIDRRDAEEKTFAADAQSLSLSADREAVLVIGRSNGQPTFALVPAADDVPDDMAPNRVRLGDWRVTIDPVSEWQQMFVDAWRMHRDFAYDPALRGVDWNAVRAQHEPLLSRIGHRAELNTILGQMASQLGILHSQVRSGDLPEDGENSDMAFLGAEYTPVSGGLRIDRIYRAEADLVSQRPALRRPGVDVRAGDIIRRVDGRPVASLADLRLALASKSGQQVRLDLTRAGASTSAIVEPMSWGGARTAAYWDFVETNRAAVDAATEGSIGYIHLRSMGSGDIATFARDYFAQMDRPGLIIDVRGNNGGNIDSIIINQFLRQPWAFWTDPEGEGVATTNMQNAYRGHVVVLIDERTYSDGETFAAGMKSLGLAPLVGTRTAGAGIWLSDRNRLVDNGAVRVAEYAQYDINGNWILEGYGVGPDYEVENMPHARFNGQDAQLGTAISLLNQRMTEEPVTPLRPRALPPLGTPGRDVQRLPD